MAIGFIFLALPASETNATDISTLNGTCVNGTYLHPVAQKTTEHDAEVENVGRTVLVGVFLLLFMGSLVYGTFAASELTLRATVDEFIALQSALIAALEQNDDDERARVILKCVALTKLVKSEPDDDDEDAAEIQGKEELCTEQNPMSATGALPGDDDHEQLAAQSQQAQI